MPRSTAYLLAAVLLVVGPARAQVATLRVSVKFFVDGDAGRAAGGGWSTDDAIVAIVEGANAVLERSGARWDVALDDIVELSGLDEWSRPLHGTGWKSDLERAAEGEPARFGWRADAVNVYVVDATEVSGLCSFPGAGAGDDDIVVIADWTPAIARERLGIEFDDAAFLFGCSSLLLHEIGHYLDLGHTQGRECGDCVPGREGECHSSPGDDGIADTAPDLACWEPDDIALASFGAAYGELSVDERGVVDSAWKNVMSYHAEAYFRPGAALLTPLQIERAGAAFAPGGARQGVVSVDCDSAVEGDCNGNGRADVCEEDCDGSGLPDDCDVASDPSIDVDGNARPDACDRAAEPLASTVDFGVVPIGSTAERRVGVRNVGPVPVTIRSARLRATVDGAFRFTSELDLPATLAPGAETVWRLSFEPNEAGVAQARLGIGTDARAGATLTIAAEAFAAPRVAFRRGDANGDAAVDLSDAVTILRYLFAGGSSLCLDALDTDDSGRLDTTDAIALLDYIFREGAAVAEPFAACGRDESPGPGCAEHPLCGVGGP